MKTKLKSIVLMGFFLTPTSSNGASFDCAKAVTHIEHTVCSNPLLSLLDEKLAHVYRGALNSSSNRERLRAEQRQWIAHIRSKCSDAACLEFRYRARIDELSALTAEMVTSTIATVPSDKRTKEPRPSTTPIRMDERDVPISNSPSETVSAEILADYAEPKAIRKVGVIGSAEKVDATKEVKAQENAVLNGSAEEDQLEVVEGIVKPGSSEKSRKNFGYLALAGIVALLVWHKFIRRRCPNCSATSPFLIESEELESWLGTKVVSDQLGNGKTRRKTLNTTYVRIRRRYKCSSCSDEWDEEDKEEK